MKAPEGLRILYGRILLEPTRTGINDAPFAFETEHVVAGRFVRSTADGGPHALIQKAREGKMASLEGEISLAAEAERPFSIYFDPIYHPFVSDGPRLPSLRIAGLAKHNLLSMAGDARQLDWEMRAAVVPFQTLDELLMHCLLPSLGQMGDFTRLEIVARSPVAIGAASTISGGEAVIQCRVARALDVGNLRLGYRILGKGPQVERGSVSGGTFQCREEDDLKVVSHRVSVGEAQLLQAFLSYDGVPLHQWWIADPTRRLNPRDAIHRVFDQDLELPEENVARSRY